MNSLRAGVTTHSPLILATTFLQTVQLSGPGVTADLDPPRIWTPLRGFGPPPQLNIPFS